MNKEQEIILKEIGKRLRARRLARGETQKQANDGFKRFGEKMNTSQYLSQIENGKRKAPFWLIFAMCAHYGISPSDLLEGLRYRDVCRFVQPGPPLG